LPGDDLQRSRRFYGALLEVLGIPVTDGPGYHPGYFAAFLQDPDGNNVEAVFHGPGVRSAVDVAITF
jgi:catechol 2,3-dioxygenase-like lactoylglutathione lyase family enzyme